MGNLKGLHNLKSKSFHFTYQTKCTANGKLYVGRHSTNNLDDGYRGSGKLLLRAIKKYGKDKFISTPLAFFDSYEELVEEESFIVSKEWCRDPLNYNIVEGAENPRMYGKDNPSWKGGISKYPNYRIKGVPHDFFGSNNPRFGYKFSEEEKLKMVNSQLTRKHIVFEGVAYPSIRNCSKLVGRSRDYIKSRCKYKTKALTLQ